MTIRQALLGAGAAAAAMTALATAATAEENRKVKIINETSFDIVRFYGSNVGEDGWQEDILGSDILRSGGSVTINFDDGSGYCMFDLKAVFDDGDELVRKRINVCEVGHYRYTQ